MPAILLRLHWFQLALRQTFILVLKRKLQLMVSVIRLNGLCYILFAYIIYLLILIHFLFYYFRHQDHSGNSFIFNISSFVFHSFKYKWKMQYSYVFYLPRWSGEDLGLWSVAGSMVELSFRVKVMFILFRMGILNSEEESKPLFRKASKVIR